MTLSETLREWGWAWRWVVKNFGKALKLREPVETPMRYFALVLISTWSFIPLAYVFSIFPWPLGVIFTLVGWMAILFVACLACMKLDVDWFHQHYEIREKQKRDKK